MTDLHTGHVVGFDIVASTRRDTVNFGMLSENLMTGKYNDAGKFAQYILVDEILSADLDGNGVMNYNDLRILIESWLECFVTKATNPKPANQAKCVLPEPVYDKFGRTVKGLWKKNRRRTETIFIEAADKTRELEAQNNQRKIKRNKRRRKRGPRVLVAEINKFDPKE